MGDETKKKKKKEGEIAKTREMASLQHRYSELCRSGAWRQAVTLLIDHHKMYPINYNSNALHDACKWENNIDAILFLLSLRQFNINQPDYSGRPPFMLCVDFGHIELLEAFLEHPHFDHRKRDDDLRTPLIAVSQIRCALKTTHALKMLIASGLPLHYLARDGADLNFMSYLSSSLTPKTEAISLWEEFYEDPRKTMRKCRKELQWVLREAAVFSLTILLCDDLLALKPDAPEDFAKERAAKHFFKIAARLHMDVQILLANRCAGLAATGIPWNEREAAFRHMIKKFQQK